MEKTQKNHCNYWYHASKHQPRLKIITKDDSNFFSAWAAGEIVRIDPETFDYFLDILPPKAMYIDVWLNRENTQAVNAQFLFAEGADYLTAFWYEHQGDGTKNYYLKKTHYISRGD